jgi:hypothetical protein
MRRRSRTIRGTKTLWLSRRKILEVGGVTSGAYTVKPSSLEEGLPPLCLDRTSRSTTFRSEAQFNPGFAIPVVSTKTVG